MALEQRVKMTKIYRNHKDFINRPKADANCNGVTQLYLDANGLTLETLKLIDCKACFNCNYCTNCIDCNYCTNCIRCNYCIDCTACTGCTYSTNCTNCNCCIECLECNHCNYCTNCIYGTSTTCNQGNDLNKESKND